MVKMVNKKKDTCQDIGGSFFHPTIIFEKPNNQSKTQFFVEIYRHCKKSVMKKKNNNYQKANKFQKRQK